MVFLYSNSHNDRNEVQQNAPSGRKLSPSAQFSTKNHRKGKIMPKEKTFWVQKSDSGYYYADISKDEATKGGMEICPYQGEILLGIMKVGELKQFKIVEVKHGTKK